MLVFTLHYTCVACGYVWDESYTDAVTANENRCPCCDEPVVPIKA